jgi:hypothetical protein
MLCAKRGDASPWFRRIVDRFSRGWKRMPDGSKGYYFCLQAGFEGLPACNILLEKLNDGYWATFAPSGIYCHGEGAKSRAVAAARLVRAAVRAKEREENAKAVVA